jgi:hypothetical protein
MPQMVRKQIYIRKQQDRLIKRLAEARGVSEAEVVRQALENEAQETRMPEYFDLHAWEQAREFMASLHALGPIEGKPRDWKREDLYTERLKRHASYSD